jgi:signal transduction histidine kinase
MRALVFTPSGRDARLLCELLERANIACHACRTAQEASDEVARGAGVLIVAEEALGPPLVAKLKQAVDAQPRWSDFPLILLTWRGAVSRQSEKQREFRHPLGNVLLLERPVRPESVLSTIHGALRARRRQYEVRDHIEQYRRAEEALRKSEKLAVAGRLAASIAHEINNPLNAVTNLHYLMAGSKSLAEIKSLLSIADEELARVAEIAKQTLKFHRESSRSADVDLRDVVESVLTLYRARLQSAGVEVVRDFEAIDTVIDGFGGELRQVFANLVGNSLDAMWKGGRLCIRMRRVRRKAREGIRLTVADTGLGIPEHIRPQLFEPFVSTKGNTGTGLGLWVAAEIVRHHEGTIQLKSRENSGTVFSVFLPYAAAENGADAERVAKSA